MRPTDFIFEEEEEEEEEVEVRDEHDSDGRLSAAIVGMSKEVSWER